MPGAPSSFLLLVVRPGAPSSVLQCAETVVQVVYSFLLGIRFGRCILLEQNLGLLRHYLHHRFRSENVSWLELYSPTSI